MLDKLQNKGDCSLTACQVQQDDKMHGNATGRTSSKNKCEDIQKSEGKVTLEGHGLK